jgi:hypothetical protein
MISSLPTTLARLIAICQTPNTDSTPTTLVKVVTLGVRPVTALEIPSVPLAKAAMPWRVLRTPVNATPLAPLAMG